MTTFDGEAFGKEIVAAVKTYLAGFEKRLTELEARTLRYRGVFVDGEVYRPGELTSHSGSLWHAETVTASKPGTDASWKLAVKRGEFAK